MTVAIQRILSAFEETLPILGRLLPFCALLSFGCAGHEHKVTPPDVPPKEDVPVQIQGSGGLRPSKPIDSGSLPYRDRPTGQMVMRSEELVFTTVDPGAWEGQPRRGEWSGLRHRGGGSEFWARYVAARRTVTLEECEADSRSTLALLREDARQTSDRRAFIGNGYEGRVQVLIHPGAGGRVEAFFVGASRCLAFVFVTDESSGFPERLQFVESEVVGSLRLLSLEERGLERRL